MSDRRTIEIKSISDADPCCPECGCNRSDVTHTYTLADGRKRRRRVCDHCGLPFHTTQEREQTEAKRVGLG